MFRCLVVPVFCCSIVLTSFAQVARENNSRPAISQSAHPAGDKVAGPDAAISVTRLREPRKAQQIYRGAWEAWTQHDPVKAERVVKRALKVYPTFPEALTLLGAIRAERRDWESAEQSLQAAIQSDPSYTPAYIALSEIYNRESQFDDAEQTAQHALSAGADDWILPYEVARALIGKEQYESALTISDNSLRSHQPGGLLHVAKAHALVGLRRYKEAVTELKAYLRDQPSTEESGDAQNLLEQLQGLPTP